MTTFRPRGLLATLISMAVPSGSRSQNAVSIRFPGRRIQPIDPQVLEPLAKRGQILLEGSEGDELQLLARPHHHRPPTMRMGRA